MPPKIVDTHFHLDLFKNENELVSQIENQQIYTIAVTNSPTVFKHTYNLCQGKDYIRPALGLHPELIDQRYKEIKRLEDYINHTKYIGEVGLDYSRNTSQQVKKKQRDVFSKILNLCSSAEKKIITIHSRRAEEDTINMIGDSNNNSTILHWYSGSLKNLKYAIDIGCYFSVNYKMLSSQKGKKILKNIPINRLLTESDGPFTKINKEVSTPFNVSNTIKLISKIVSKNEIIIQEQIFRNFKTLLNK